jgi:hypothetical protein
VVLKKFKEDYFGMSKIILSLTILFLITGCGHNYYVIFTDEETNAHFVRMHGTRLTGGFDFVALNTQRFEKRGHISYSFFIEYQGFSYINIDSGGSLAIIIDGQRNEFEGKGSKSHRDRILPTLVHETAYYHDVEPDFIRKLAYAKYIEIEVHGSTYVLNRHFEEKNRSGIKYFYDHYVDTEVSYQFNKIVRSE